MNGKQIDKSSITKKFKTKIITLVPSFADQVQ